MAHLEVSATAAVAASPERAWEVLSDTAHYAEWVEGTIEVTRTDGPTAPGSTYDEINPVLGPWTAKTHWTVTDFDPPRRQVHSAEGIPGAKSFEVVMEVVPVADACEVTMRLRGETGLGPLGGAFGALQKGRLQKQVQSAVDSLAERLAAPQAAGQPSG